MSRIGLPAPRRLSEIPRRSRKATEPRHHQHVVVVQLGKDLTKLGAVGLGSARCLAEHLFASGLGQLTHLYVNALAVD
jgi:hypothetical protein